MYVCILEHTHSLFLLHCERSSLTPIRNNRQNYGSVYFWTANWKTKYSALNDSKHSLISICS